MHPSEMIIDFCSNLITTTGYVGIFILMFCESTYFPVPSEAVMPFVGLVAAQVARGERPSGPEFWLGVIVGALGGLGGSLATYYFGRWFGPVGVRKWGRYAGLVEKDLDLTHRLFERRGSLFVFVARFIPVVRHFISTVAGIGRMNLGPFVLMTTSGAFLWDLILTWAGYNYGKVAQDTIHRFNLPADIVVVLLGFVFLAYVARKIRARKSSPVLAEPLADTTPNAQS